MCTTRRLATTFYIMFTYYFCPTSVWLYVKRVSDEGSASVWQTILTWTEFMSIRNSDLIGTDVCRQDKNEWNISAVRRNDTLYTQVLNTRKLASNNSFSDLNHIVTCVRNSSFFLQLLRPRPVASSRDVTPSPEASQPVRWRASRYRILYAFICVLLLTRVGRPRLFVSSRRGVEVDWFGL